MRRLTKERVREWLQKRFWLRLHGWIEAIWRKTVWTFLAVLALSILLGWYAQKGCPEARRLKDAIECKR